MRPIVAKPPRGTRKIAAQARRDGFDLTYIDDGVVKPQCSQCQALVINGTPTHEHGCPNKRK